MTQKGEELVENFIEALKNPTRASIFYQLAKEAEATATEIARNLDIDVDVVYYHLKLLRKAKLISEPRVVVKGNYVEKYYAIRRDFREKILQYIKIFSEKEKELSTKEFRKIVIALLSVIESILISSIKRLKKVKPEVINKIREEEDFESKIIFCSKERYNQLLKNLREAARGDILDTFDPITKEYTIAIVAIPKLE